MRITKVSIDGELDEFGGRALIINTNSSLGTFKTPNRAMTSFEFDYKSQLPFKPTLKNEMSEIVKTFYGDTWSEFRNTNETPYKIKNKIDKYSAKMAYTIKRFYPQIASDTLITKDDIHHLLTIQRVSELDFISMPSLHSSERNFKKISESFVHEVLEEKKEPLIYLDMGLEHDIFKDRYQTLIELSKTDQLHSIGLIYRSHDRYSQNYELLWRNRDQEVLLQMSEVPREFSGNRLTSTMHLLQKVGIDAFSVKLTTYHPDKKENKEDKKKTPLRTVGDVNRFDSRDIVFRRFREWSEHDASLNCNCMICKGRTAKEFVDEYQGEFETYPGQTFNAANRIHEYSLSSGEFEESRKFIRGGELKDYFKTRGGLKACDILFQKNLFEFK